MKFICTKDKISNDVGIWIKVLKELCNYYNSKYFIKRCDRNDLKN